MGLEFAYLFPLTEPNYNLWDGIDSFLSIAVPVVGTVYAYKKNGGELGKDFANKYFSIGFVLGIRFLVYLILPMVILTIYWSIDNGNEETETTFVEIFILYTWYIYFYYQLGKHISETNADTKSIDEFQK